MYKFLIIYREYIILLSAVVLVLAIISYFVVDHHNSMNQEYRRVYKVPYNKEIWVKNKQNTDFASPRKGMVDDLLKNHLRKGMNKTDVEVLLGKPDYTYNGYNHFFIGNYPRSYSDFAMDVCTLGIHYQNELVDEIEIFSH